MAGATFSDTTASGLVTRLRTTFAAGHTTPLAWRKEQLTRIRALVVDHREDIATSLHTDLRRPRAEADRGDVDPVIREVDHLLDHLEQWLHPQPVPVDDSSLPAGSTARTQYDPLGTVLVIAPWNYPVQLLLIPLAGAIAAGNTVVAKPSELAPATSALLADLMGRYLDSDAVAVVEGGVEETTALLAQRFDHIFYTGNGTVGRIVMQAAAQNLTPVTLELGGKSPVYVDRDVDLAVVADRLTQTKFTNAGQTCVAPDYILTDPDTADELERALRQAIHKRYGADPANSPDFGRIVNHRHFDRVAALLDSGRIAIGGQHRREDNYIAPTVLADVPPDSSIMQEEIFGPILPILTVADLDEAITFINNRDKPLALYGFTSNNETRRRLATETSSGSLGFGLPIAHLRISALPFGGVGESGTGSYHGPHSITAFSHRKAILDVPLT